MSGKAAAPTFAEPGRDQAASLAHVSSQSTRCGLRLARAELSVCDAIGLSVWSLSAQERPAESEEQPVDTAPPTVGDEQPQEAPAGSYDVSRYTLGNHQSERFTFPDGFRIQQGTTASVCRVSQ
jgi:hypothetical protein